MFVFVEEKELQQLRLDSEVLKRKEPWVQYLEETMQNQSEHIESLLVQLREAEAKP